MPTMTFMQFVDQAVARIRDDLNNVSAVVSEIHRLPKKDAILVTAYLVDHLQGENNYSYILGAFARHV